MAAQQALDWLGLRAEETAPLCHPADEPPARLQILLQRVEAFARHRKATHLIFSGYGACAAAGAVTCHARGCPGVWLRPADPAGVIDGLTLEGGYRRIIEACAPAVTAMEIPALPPASDPPGDWTRREIEGWSPAEEIEGLRGDAPSALIAVQRREWGIGRDVTTQLGQAAAAWAAARPEIDWLIMSNLNARLEAPVRALEPRPSNLLIVPPLPFPCWRTLSMRSRYVLTDSHGIAAEAMREGVALAVLADSSTDDRGGFAQRIVSDDLSGDRRDETLGRWLDAPTGAKPAGADSRGDRSAIADAIDAWLCAAND
jgi:hypothetical protein